MKSQKGDIGYLKKHKRNAIIKASLEFGVVIALLVLGIIETGTRLNLLTVVAILGCLPAAKALVEVIMIVPHKSIHAELAECIRQQTEGMTVAYDLILTTEKKILPIDCIVIAGNAICGYSSNTKMDVEFAGKYLKQMLNCNQFAKVSVKIFANEEQFLARIREMQERERKHEEAIKRVVLNLSL